MIIVYVPINRKFTDKKYLIKTGNLYYSVDEFREVFPLVNISFSGTNIHPEQVKEHYKEIYRAKSDLEQIKEVFPEEFI